jgi:hypothetical protein
LGYCVRVGLGTRAGCGKLAIWVVEWFMSRWTLMVGPIRMESILFTVKRMLLVIILLLLVMDELLQAQIRKGEKGEGD